MTDMNIEHDWYPLQILKFHPDVTHHGESKSDTLMPILGGQLLTSMMSQVKYN